MIQIIIAILNVNINSNQFDKPKSDNKKIIYYDNKSYILKIFQTIFNKKNYYNTLMRYFKIEKIFKLFIYKYYSLIIKADMKK